MFLVLHASTTTNRKQPFDGEVLEFVRPSVGGSHPQDREREVPLDDAASALPGGARVGGAGTAGGPRLQGLRYFRYVHGDDGWKPSREAAVEGDGPGHGEATLLE